MSVITPADAIGESAALCVVVKQTASGSECGKYGECETVKTGHNIVAANITNES